jgi:hypothetical protein
LYHFSSTAVTSATPLMTMSASTTTTTITTGEEDTTASIPSWKDLQAIIGQTVVGQALNDDLQQRQQGYGAPHVHNTLRKFDSTKNPKITLYRDHAGK